MNLAYIRVSTREQNESRQMVSLECFGIEKWFMSTLFLLYLLTTCLNIYEQLFEVFHLL